jgi:hypothetical protein
MAAELLNRAVRLQQPYLYEPLAPVYVPQNLPCAAEQEATRKRNALLLYERCIYIAAAFAAAAFAAWITWVPFIHLLIPGLKHDRRNAVTTVSHTFAKYNSLVTIYLVGPLTIFFVFRTYRVFVNKKLANEEKKGVFLLLLLVQYSLFIVMRYDAVQEFAHYFFTFATIVLLYVYHLLVVDSPHVAEINGVRVKTIFMWLSVLSITGFATLFLITDNLENNESLHTLACLLEVCGILFLGLLDLTDIYVLGFEIDCAKLE